MGRVAVVVAMCTAMLVTAAQAQTTHVPSKPPGSTVRPPHGDQGSAERERATTSEPNLRGSIPQPGRPPEVKEHKAIRVAPAASPPKAARPASPDGGGTSECDCYQTEFVDTRDRDGRIVRQQYWRLTGRKSLNCCPRR